MKVLKLVLVLILISLQANATGYSHNMIVAQKMLKTKKVSKKAAVKIAPVPLTTRTTSLKPSTCPVSESQEKGTTVLPESIAASFSQYITRWIVRVVCIDGQVLDEKFVSLFSAEEDVEKDLPHNAHFLSVTDNIVSYITSSLRIVL